MANGNQKTNVTNGTEQNVAAEQQVQQPVEAQVPQQLQQVVQQVQEQKNGFGSWLKQHWKGAVAGVVGLGATVSSAVIAYKKGKAAGIMSVPQPQQDQDDYSLNPNE